VLSWSDSLYSHACARVHMRAHVRLLARSLAQVRAHSKGTLGLAAHTHARLCRHCVIALHHKGAHDAAAAPALPAHHRQLGEHTTAPRHNTPHLDQVAQVPGAEEHSRAETGSRTRLAAAPIKQYNRQGTGMPLPLLSSSSSCCTQRLTASAALDGAWPHS